MILDDIVAYKRGELAAQKERVPLATLQAQIATTTPPLDFAAALKRLGVSLIAEVKRSSPSKGVLMKDMDPVDVSGAYESAGARAISILTDNRYFGGSLRDFTTVRQDVGIPCLRKEFIIDEYQIHESRAHQADAILLIVRILSDDQLKDYLQLARGLGLHVLVETHDAAEIERAMKAGAHIIGINNRDLSTFTVDIATTLNLKKYVPGGYVLVSESGIFTREHVKALEDGGVDAILVGEALVTSQNITETIKGMLGSDES